MATFTLVLLWSSAVAFAAIGVIFLTRPVQGASSIGIEIPGDTGRTEIRATYGGMMLGLALLFSWSAAAEGQTLAGLWSMIFVYGGFAFGRALAIVLGARPSSKMWWFLIIEIAYVAGSIFCLA